MTLLHAAALVAADSTPDDSKVTPGLVGFALFVLLGVATVLLWFSMNRHLKRARRGLGAPGAPPVDGPGSPEDGPPGPSDEPPSVNGRRPTR